MQGGGVCHAGVGWDGVGCVMQGWGGVGHAGGVGCHAGVGWGGSCWGGVGHVGVGGWVIHVEEFTFNFL